MNETKPVCCRQGGVAFRDLGNAFLSLIFEWKPMSDTQFILAELRKQFPNTETVSDVTLLKATDGTLQRALAELKAAAHAFKEAMEVARTAKTKYDILERRIDLMLKKGLENERQSGRS